MTDTQTLSTSDEIFRYSHWNSQLEDLKENYRHGKPYPHIVLEEFLNRSTAQEVHRCFPKIGQDGWIQYLHYNEKKFGKNNPDAIDKKIVQVLNELNSPAFVQFLSELTGIKGLFADPAFEGGGLHQTPPKGFLNIHADFTVHPHHYDWRRRINVIVYLNSDWKEEYGGHLEVWDQKMKECWHKVLPTFNRAFIFNTDIDSFHGHPDPLTCPPDNTRKSLALYYFTKEPGVLVRSTNYRARPGQPIKAIFVACDRFVLKVYDWVKRRFGFDDAAVSKFLGTLDRFKKKFR